jgi:hypothetical protein
LILLGPAIFYFVFPGPRYRHPIEPVMTILGVYLLTEAGKEVEKDDIVREKLRI